MAKQNVHSGFQLWKIVLFFFALIFMGTFGGYKFASYQTYKKLLVNEARTQKLFVELQQRDNEIAELKSELKKTKSHKEDYIESINDLKNALIQEVEFRIQKEKIINQLESRCGK